MTLPKHVEEFLLRVAADMAERGEILDEVSIGEAMQRRIDRDYELAAMIDPNAVPSARNEAVTNALVTAVYEQLRRTR